MFKKLILSLLLASVLFFPKTAFGDSSKTAVIVNPIRGTDFWSESWSILDTPKQEYEQISKNNLAATWLIRYDGLKTTKAQDFLKGLNKSQEIGLFLEITPTLTSDAGIKYNQSKNSHAPQSIFLIGYSPKDREKLIDTAFGKFKEIFGFYPKSAGAWWVDAYSLDYMRAKYSIEANMDVADQFSTDQYSVWGQYFSTPFYPSKNNALVPAESKDTKIGAVTIQWATRDPFNGYGNGAIESTYSVQPNDYLRHHLDINYFKKLINIYPQITVGLENNFSWTDFGSEYASQIQTLVQMKNNNQLMVTDMVDFAHDYQRQYPDISPNVLITADDPLGGTGKVVWYQTPKYRMGWFYGVYGSAIRDLREFNDSNQESCFSSACQDLNLATAASKALDDVTFSTRWLIDEGRISNFKVIKNDNSAQITYQNESGMSRSIKLLPNDIDVNGKVQPISFAILEAINAAKGTHKKVGPEGSLVHVDLQKQSIDLSINFGKFLSFSLLFFLLPGWVLSRRLLLSMPVGWVIFTLASFLGGYLKIDWLVWFLPSLSLVSLFKTGLPKFRINLRLVDFFLLVVILLGSFSWLITVVKSGFLYDYGMGFWGPNGHDGVWHLALISELKRNFPPNNPVFVGSVLSNYHYFFDLLLAKSSVIFGISELDLLFRFFPLMFSLLSGWLFFRVTQKLFNNKMIGSLATFFLYFGGSFGYVVTFLRNRTLGGESTFWSQQAISTLLNPPFAISVILLLSGLLIFLELLDKPPKFSFKFLCLILLWGVLIEFKVYAGLLVLGSLAIFSFEKIIFKKDWSWFLLSLPIGLLALVVFLPNNTTGSSLVVFSPFWLISTMIDFPDRLGWTRLSLTLHSNNLIKQVLAYLVGLMIFIVGNFGIRIIGLFKLTDFFNNRFLFYFTSLGIIFPLLFIQKGTNWNTVQFLYYSLLIINLWAASVIVSIWNRFGARVGWLIIGLVILLTLPTSYDNLWQYLPSRPPARLSNPELAALDFLKKQAPGTVMMLPFDENLRDQYSEPVPLVAYAPTGYVAAFSNHPVFLEDTINLDILGVDYKGRLNLERDISKIPDQVKNILRDNSISYLYVVRSQGFEEDEGRMGIKKIFENEETKIFKVI